VIVLLVGLAVLWASKERRARRIALVAVTLLAALVAAAAVTVFSWFDVSLNDGVGDRAYTPSSAADVQPSYELGVGTLRLDLSDVPANRPLDVDARVGIGELRVIVPRDAAVVVDSRVKAGSITALDRTDDGRNARLVVGGRGNLHLHARVGAGKIDVVRAG
jgi:predicted membrane protein